MCVFFDFCGGGDNSTSDGTMLEMTALTEADDLEAVLDAVKDFGKSVLILHGTEDDCVLIKYSRKISRICIKIAKEISENKLFNGVGIIGHHKE